MGVQLVSATTPAPASPARTERSACELKIRIVPESCVRVILFVSVYHISLINCGMSFVFI